MKKLEAKKRIIAWTGHRPDKLGGYGDSPLQDWVRQQIRAQLKVLKPFSNNIGMAVGFDQWVAEECISLGYQFEAYVPFAGQDSRWPPAGKAKYQELLAHAAFIHFVCDGPYAAWKMQRRNEAMVRNANHAVACWDGSPGGTKNCLDYIHRYRDAVGHNNYGLSMIDPRLFA